MGRPTGVTVIAVLLVGFSLWLLNRLLPHLGRSHSRPILIAAGLLLLLTVLVGESLWSLRSHAFLLFMMWGVSAMVALALTGRPGALMAPLVCAGLAIAVAGVYLRREI